MDEKPTKRSSFFCDMMLARQSLRSKPYAFNIGVNEGEIAGRSIDHLHVQIIPRYLKDVVDPVGGIRNVIPGMGNYR